MMKSFLFKKVNFKKLLLSFGIVVASCVAISAVLGWKRNFIPNWVRWQEKSIELKFDEDKARYTTEIKSKRLEVRSDKGERTFLTDENLKIQDALATDIDSDGKPEIIAVVWKKGLFGRHRPFWIQSDEKTYSQHVFIYGVDEKGIVTQKWFASETGIFINRMKLMEKNNKILLFEDSKGNCSLWKWESFGLKNIKNKVTLAAFGDNMIHTPIYEYANSARKGNFDFLYEPYLEDINSADISAFNAESVLVDDARMISGYPSFGAPTAVGDAIVNAGFDIAVCANNHILDKGIGELEYTKRFYESENLICPGIQDRKDVSLRPYELISRNGISFAIFSYTYGTNAGDISVKFPYVVHYLPKSDEERNELLWNLQRAREEADVVIVFVHWGDEYEERANAGQRDMAALFAKGGADVVIGSHPHVIQEVEEIERPDGEKCLVYYSLGNFVADQGMEAGTKAGGEAVISFEHTYDGVKVTGHELKEITSYWKDLIKTK